MISCDQCNVIYGERPKSCPLDDCPLVNSILGLAAEQPQPTVDEVVQAMHGEFE